MVRPKKDRIVKFNPEVCYFKPRAIPLMELEEVCLTVDEREAIRLADLVGLSHAEAGENMGVSRATFGRIVARARKIIADAMINGKAIRIEGGNYKIVEETRNFVCDGCGHSWEEPMGTGRPAACPGCGNDALYRFLKDEK